MDTAREATTWGGLEPGGSKGAKDAPRVRGTAVEEGEESETQ